MKNYLYNISLFLTYCLPIALLTGPAIPDLIIVTISFLFLFKSFIDKDFAWINLPYTKVFFIFWLSLLFISFFSNNYYNSFANSVILIRYILFLTAIIYWIILKKNQVKILLIIVLLHIVILLFDSLFQFIGYSSEKGFGPDIFGFTSSWYGRMTGPFNDEIIGANLSKFFFIALFGILYFFKIERFNKIYLALFYLFTLISIYLSGERMALSTFLLGSFLFIILIKEYRNILIMGLVGSFFILIIIINYHKSYNDFKILESKPHHLGLKIEKIYDCENTIKGCSKIVELQPDFFTVIKDFKNSVYYSIFLSGYKIWKDNPITGVGLNNYEYTCENNIKYQTKRINYGNCSSHPHNFYLQWLTESGIIGFVFFITFIITLFINSLKNYSFLGSKISLINLSIIFWPIMSTGSLLKNFHGITTFFIITLCILITKKTYD